MVNISGIGRNWSMGKIRDAGDCARCVAFFWVMIRGANRANSHPASRCMVNPTPTGRPYADEPPRFDPTPAPHNPSTAPTKPDTPAQAPAISSNKKGPEPISKDRPEAIQLPIIKRSPRFRELGLSVF